MSSVEGTSSPGMDQKIQSLLNNSQFDEASSLIEERLVSTPDDADAYYLKGVFHYFQGEIGPAIQNLRRSLELDSRHTDSAICLSVLLNDVGKYDDAKSVFERANQSVAHRRESDELGVEQKFAIKHLELGDLYFRYRRYDEAIEEYGKAAVLDPSTPDIRIRRAKAFAKKGYVSRAIQELQQLKNKDPHFLPARIQLGLLHYSQGNILDAELEWEGVLDLDPTHREARSYLDMANQARLNPQSK